MPLWLNMIFFAQVYCSQVQPQHSSQVSHETLSNISNLAYPRHSLSLYLYQNPSPQSSNITPNSTTILSSISKSQTCCQQPATVNPWRSQISSAKPTWTRGRLIRSPGWPRSPAMTPLLPWSLGLTHELSATAPTQTYMHTCIHVLPTTACIDQYHTYILPPSQKTLS